MAAEQRSHSPNQAESEDEIMRQLELEQKFQEQATESYAQVGKNGYTGVDLDRDLRKTFKNLLVEFDYLKKENADGPLSNKLDIWFDKVRREGGYK